MPKDTNNLSSVTVKKMMPTKSNVTRVFKPKCHFNRGFMLSDFANFQASKAVLTFSKQQQTESVMPPKLPTPKYKNVDGMM